MQAIIRPNNIAMTTQQFNMFCNNPNKEHEKALKIMCCHLRKTKDKGFILRHDKSNRLDFILVQIGQVPGGINTVMIHYQVICGKAKYSISLL